MRTLNRGTGSAAAVAFVLLLAPCARAQERPASVQSTTIRGQRQMLHVYGPPTGYPVIISSGDGGWIHLGPHVAETLAAAGFFVVGFDAKAYLEGFTTPQHTLVRDDVPRDYEVLIDIASHASHEKPLLVGVSEGAGLSVLAATDPDVKRSIAGVIGLGLPDVNELGWRWKDALTYLTHRIPDEPTFSTAALASQLAPLPVAAIHSTRDEFVPVEEVRRVLDHAAGPHRLWVLNASNHRFSGNIAELDRRLLEAIDWVRQNTPACTTP
jgi:Bacterial virulence protein (VirJ)